MSNHLGNVLVTISDRRKAVCNNEDSTLGYNAVVLTATDYYAFGSVMVGREYVADTTDNYRFGFNGKEKTDEIYGDGNGVDFGARIYDPRLGRWMSVDPLAGKFPDASPYNFANNNPLYFIDPNGKSGQPNHVQRGMDKQEEYEKKGYSTVLMVSKSGDVKLRVYETKTYNEWVELEDGTFEFREVQRIEYKETIKFARDLRDDAIDLINGVDDWTESLKGSAEFNWGVIITSKLGGKKNPFASKASENGKFIEIDQGVLKALGSLDSKAQSKWFKQKGKTIGSKLTEKMNDPPLKNDKDIEKRGKKLGGRLNDIKDKVPQDTTEYKTDTVREDNNKNNYGVRRVRK